MLILTFLCDATANNQKGGKPNPTAPQTNSAGRKLVTRPAPPPQAPQPAIASSQIMLPLNIAANAVNTAASSLTTVTPQPVIVNNQLFLLLE